MMSAAGPWESCPVLQGLPGIINILTQCKSLEEHIDSNNYILDEVNSAMSFYNLSDSEKLLARFGDRVGIIIALEQGGKISEQDAFEQIKAMYKEIKTVYKNKKENQ